MAVVSAFWDDRHRLFRCMDCFSITELMETLQNIGVILAVLGALIFLFRKFLRPKKKGGKDCDNCH